MSAADSPCAQSTSASACVRRPRARALLTRLCADGGSAAALRAARARIYFRTSFLLKEE